MVEVRKTLIARNSLLNFGGQFIPLVVGVVSIPYVIAGLGVNSFGILSLAWMLLGYFTIFDLGLGRAATKFIAAELRNGSPEKLRTLFWTTSLLNLLLGIAGGIILGCVSPLLAERVFQIPPDLVTDATRSFFLLALSCPIVLVSTAFRGALEAAQRFEYVNAVNVISSSLTFLLPVIGVALRLDVTEIVLLLMGAKLSGAVAYLLLCIRVFPILKQSLTIDLKGISKLLTYGGWVSVTNVVHPILTYFERLLIGSVISIAAVTYYTAPYEMVTRLSILPTSLTMALFPSFSEVTVSEQRSMANLYSRSVKLLLVLMAPLVSVLIFFSREILRLWLGPDFSDISAIVLQILAAGVLLNAMAQIPYAMIQGFGRPDITAKFHLLEVVIYVPLVWILVKNLGIVGGALAWTLRSILDSGLLFAASFRFIDLQALLEKGLNRGIIVVALLMVLLAGCSLVQAGILFKTVSTATILVVFSFTAWRFVLDASERDLFVSAARSLTGITTSS